MLITWMSYAFAIAAIVAVTALALDRLAAVWNEPRRVIWMAALVIGVVLPAAVALRPSRIVAPPVVDDAPSAVTISARQPIIERVSTIVRARPVLPPLPAPPSLNRVALGVWISSSLVLLVALARAFAIVHRKRASWRETDLDGHTVFITEDLGPAVVGVMRPRIVLPEWALSLGATDRALMLRHEVEHIRARDPVVLLLSALLLVLFPWNAALWFIVRRLRLAMEIDCDRRVLAADVPAKDYGLLLLTVGARSSAPLQFTASLAEPRLFLERRIIAMTTSRARRPILASLPFAGVALAAAAIAAQTPRPASVRMESPTPSVARVAPQSAPPVITATPPAQAAAPAARVATVDAIAITPNASPATTEQQNEEPKIPFEVIRGWIAEHHPGVITGDPSINSVSIVVDDRGRYVRSVADSVSPLAVNLLKDAIAAISIGLFDRDRAERPLFIIDGVRHEDVQGLDFTAIKTANLVKTPEMIDRYGDAARNGVVFVETDESFSGLRPLSLSPAKIKWFQETSPPPGKIGPNRVRVVLVQLS